MNDHEILLREIDRLNEGIFNEKREPLNEIKKGTYENQMTYEDEQNMEFKKNGRILQENLVEFGEDCDGKVLPSPEFAFKKNIEFS